MPTPEPWLRGPVPGVSPLLQPAAHCLLQCAEDIPRAVLEPHPVDREALGARPGGIPSLAFHLRHVAGSIDRLLAYAAGRPLDDAQRAALAAEADPPGDGDTAEALVDAAVAAVHRALAALRTTGEGELLEPREVGRQRLPSTVLGLLFHVAEHTQRHTGQIVTTGRVARRG